MSVRLSYVGVWVHDQEEALAWYTQKLGFELREDVTLPEFGGYRWLTVGPPGQPEIALTLNVPGPPVCDPATATALLDLVGRGLAGGYMLATEDCQATYDELLARGVEFQQPPTRQPYGIDAALRDASGNSIRLVQQMPLER
jgi:catechol 2,3-dioxygenase-like lactoylglutathione lyase family enzyme